MCCCLLLLLVECMHTAGPEPGPFLSLKSNKQSEREKLPPSKTSKSGDEKSRGGDREERAAHNKQEGA